VETIRRSIGKARQESSTLRARSRQWVAHGFCRLWFYRLSFYGILKALRAPAGPDKELAMGDKGKKDKEKGQKQKVVRQEQNVRDKQEKAPKRKE
jgi:hypothetical protein